MRNCTCDAAIFDAATPSRLMCLPHQKGVYEGVKRARLRAARPRRPGTNNGIDYCRVMADLLYNFNVSGIPKCKQQGSNPGEQQEVLTLCVHKVFFKYGIRVEE
ncbi:hypothetical protein FOZ62_032260, partial [Perkinsus olseni]